VSLVIRVSVLWTDPPYPRPFWRWLLLVKLPRLGACRRAVAAVRCLRGDWARCRLRGLRRVAFLRFALFYRRDAGYACSTSRHLTALMLSPLTRSTYFFSVTSISNVTGATFPSFQSANDTVTFALPTPASAGTRTGP